MANHHFPWNKITAPHIDARHLHLPHMAVRHHAELRSTLGSSQACPHTTLAAAWDDRDACSAYRCSDCGAVLPRDTVPGRWEIWRP
jgi:hypothetical protein